eukprot:NODE_4742_length_645_cov_160.771186.p1 GENE.NODE_4742_length_645_cov_160.771186~~NODE_4742_length_645_cov_160.771186.p1  ORF type:complete len:178 (+),score=41.39 NODE_4742_length_645_cov_160.771186:3-536(+)
MGGACPSYDVRSPLAWCGSALFGVADGQLVESSGLGGTGDWGRCFELTSRKLPLPSSTGVPERVEEVAVCPRTLQRLAVRLENGEHVLVFERSIGTGWAKQDLVLRGRLHASHRRGGEMGDEVASAMPRALAFAVHAPRWRQLTTHYEGSLLAVYWASALGAEVRTYPMHYMPQSMT